MGQSQTLHGSQSAPYLGNTELTEKGAQNLPRNPTRLGNKIRSWPNIINDPIIRECSTRGMQRSFFAEETDHWIYRNRGRTSSSSTSSDAEDGSRRRSAWAPPPSPCWSLRSAHACFSPLLTSHAAAMAGYHARKAEGRKGRENGWP